MEHLADDLGDQVVFAGEVVADHALADAEPYRDTRERGVRVANFGDRVDRSLDDLRPSGAAHERAVVVPRPLTAWPKISTTAQFYGPAAKPLLALAKWVRGSLRQGHRRSDPVRGRLARPGAGDHALTVERLSKRFGDRVAFDDVSFEVGYGEVFGFLGPNGAGKTTTVRTLGTLIAPTSGSATVAGIPLSAENGPAIRARISIMPESPGLYLRLTVMENLRCFAGLYELDDVRGRIERALRAVNLLDRAGDPCGSLSKGLRQRVALARALLNDPAVLFLDEPTSGLDPVATREVHELIASLRERGVTIFLTTHRLEEAERLCDRVAILNTTLRLIGRPDELRAAAVQAIPGRAGPRAARRSQGASSALCPRSKDGSRLRRRATR